METFQNLEDDWCLCDLESNQKDCAPVKETDHVSYSTDFGLRKADLIELIKRKNNLDAINNKNNAFVSHNNMQLKLQEHNALNQQNLKSLIKHKENLNQPSELRLHDLVIDNQNDVQLMLSNLKEKNKNFINAILDFD